MKAAEAKTSKKKTTPRLRGTPRHRSFHLSKKKLKQAQPLPSAPALLKQSIKTIWSRKRVFLGMTFIHGLLTFVFILGLGSSFDLVSTKKSLEEILGNSSSQASNGIALFGYLAGTAGSGAAQGSGVYQVLMALIISLAAIWAARQVLAGEKPGLRDPFYKGMFPLIPFVMVVIVIMLELIPLAVGNIIYSTVIQNGLAVSTLEKVLWFVLLILFLLLSLYMIISSIFSLYIVSLPDVKPLVALKSARELVLHRRVSIILRFVALPAAIAIVFLAVFIPIIIFITPVAQPLFLLSTSFIIVYFHVYMYTLYRSLL